jgi:large subunit ribosomal protein L32e
MMPSSRSAVRKKLTRKKPVFRRHLYHRFIKFQNQDSWRKPKGNDNKMRLQLKGYPPIVKIGYRNPREIRGLHPSGLELVIVDNEKTIERLDPSKHVVVISSTTGLRKKQRIIEAAERRGLKIANKGVRVI